MKIKTDGGMLPRDFKEAVSMLTRPYYPITEDRYNKIINQLTQGGTDFFLYKGKRSTVGDADGGKAIMPLRKNGKIKNPAQYRERR